MNIAGAFVMATILFSAAAHAEEGPYAPFGLVVGKSIYELPGGTAYEGLTKFGYAIVLNGSNALDGKVVTSAAEYTAWREVAITEQANDELVSTRPDLGLSRIPADKRRSSGTSSATWTFKANQNKRTVSIGFDPRTGMIGRVGISVAYDLPAERDEMLATMAKVCRAAKGTRKDGCVMSFDVQGRRDPVAMRGEEMEAMLDRFVGQQTVPAALQLGTGESWGNSGNPDVTVDFECHARNLRPGQDKPDVEITVMDVRVKVERKSALAACIDKDFRVEVSRRVKEAPKPKPATTNTGGM